MNRIETETVVVGSGPGGATVARGLAKAGKRVVLLERGRHHTWVGNHVAALTYVDKAGLLFSEEGLNVVRGITTGGSTLIYTGTAAGPPTWLKEQYGIDIDFEVAQTEEELKIQPLPEEKLGEAALRIMRAANDLGYAWEPLPKFIDPDKCVPECSDCMLGCKHGAKWTSREYVKEAQQHGARFMNRVSIREVIVENARAVGVRGKNVNGPIEVYADVVVLAAGGLGTPVILQRSGIYDAGQGFFCDPTTLIYGIAEGRGTASGPPMTVGTYEFYDSDGFMLSSIIDPRYMFLIQMLLKGVQHVPMWFRYGRVLAIMTKIKDGLDGRVNLDGTFSKPFTYEDRSRIDKATIISEKILIKAGCDPDSIVCTRVRGTHPGGTARIGHVLDNNLETQIKNLYVCDASIYPESLDRPVVLITIGMAKRLAARLLQIM